MPRLDEDPALNPPDEMACRECGEEVIPGNTCECGEVAPTEKELEWEAQERRAEEMYEAQKYGDFDDIDRYDPNPYEGRNDPDDW